MDLGTYRYYVDWDNGPGQSPPVEPFLGAFDDISAYALKADWSYGSDSGTPGQTKAGSASITLDNSSSLFSSYNTLSDIYGKILPGIWVRITMQIGAGAEVTMWQGKLDSIVPRVGDRVTVSTATLQAYGSLQQASADADIDIPMQTDITTGAAADLILDAAGYPAADRDIDTGLSTMSRFWARKGRVLDLLRELEAQETGLLRETKDGKIQFESRAHRASAPHTTARSTYGTGTLRPWNLQQEDPLLDIFNSIEAKVRTFNKSETVALATICDVRNGTGGPPIPFANGKTKVIDIEFPTPSSPSQLLAVETWGIVTVEINTTEAGDGTDLTNLVTMSRQELGRTLRCTFVNSSGSAGYFIRLFVNGVAIVEGDPLTVSAEDTTSQAKFRKRALPNPSQWLTQLAEGQAYCNHIIALYKNPRPALRFTLKANYNATHLAEAQAIDVSDRIHITANLGTFGLGINGDFFVESLHHKVNEGRIHEVQVYCRAITTHSWPASGTAYTAKVVSPPGAPDDYICNAMDPDSRVIIGIQAQKYTVGIYEAQFRAKLVAAGTQYPSLDLRTTAEGGTLVHNGTDSWIYEGRGATPEHGAQMIVKVPAQGVLFYTARLANAAGGWGLWSDGNPQPKIVTDSIPLEDPSTADVGPAADWSISVKEGSAAGTAVVTFGRPATYGHKIVAIVVQIAAHGLTSPATPWIPIDDPSITIYDGSAISHTYNKRLMTLTIDGSPAGSYGAAAPGDLILFDNRGGAFGRQYCGWGTIPVDGITGPTIRYIPGFIPAFDPDVNDDYADIRIKIVTPPWEWLTDGYLGGNGLWEKVYWIPPNRGDRSTQTFVTDPIPLPAGVDITDVQARVWFENGYYSRSDDDTYSDFGTGGGSSTGQGCVLLPVVAGHVATDVSLGNVFAINSDADFVLDNPTGPVFCGMTVVWAITGAGVPTLDSKFRLMTNEYVTKSAGRDLCGAIYNDPGDEWDTFWKQGP